LVSVLDLIKGKPITDLKNIIYCDDDGESLCLYDTAIDFELLVSVSNRLTTDVFIEDAK
jgi:hypothetical protein